MVVCQLLLYVRLFKAVPGRQFIAHSGTSREALPFSLELSLEFLVGETPRAPPARWFPMRLPPLAQSQAVSRRWG